MGFFFLVPVEKTRQGLLAGEKKTSASFLGFLNGFF